LEPKNVLEVGIGSGLTKYVLEHAGVSVITADIDKDLAPDYQADVRSLPFEENQFDAVAAFQILEHLPFQDFEVALRELRRVSRRYVCISLPDSGIYLRFKLHLTGKMRCDRWIDLSGWRRKAHLDGGEHYWEINEQGFEIDTVRSTIRKAGLTIKNENRLLENMYHRLFILEK
jgi:ubiquinone/menaquinone biosynthesis C-methylase UbiE